MVMDVMVKGITADDVRAVEADDKLIEISEGEWEEQTMASIDHGQIAADLVILIGGYVKANRLGQVYTEGTTFVLEGTPEEIITMRLPDVSFVRAERVQKSVHDYYYLAPDIAIEIISHSERPSKIAKKLREYRQAGVRQIWQVYPEDQEIIVYEGEDMRVYGLEDTLDGGEVLPDFKLPLKSLFA